MKRLTKTQKKYTIITTIVIAIVYALVYTVTEILAHSTQNQPLANGVVALFGFLLMLSPIALAFPVYWQLRKKHLSTRSEVVTTIIVTVGIFAGTQLYELIIMPLALQQYSTITSLPLLLLANSVITFVLAILGAGIAKRIYAKRHSIVIE